jgi:hypothetical protein
MGQNISLNTVTSEELVDRISVPAVKDFFPYRVRNSSDTNNGFRSVCPRGKVTTHFL